MSVRSRYPATSPRTCSSGTSGRCSWRNRVRAAWAFFVVAAAAYAQDTRTVTEPAIPPSCFVLSAKLAAVGGKTLAEADEDKLDTNRIQKALDGCPNGQAVERKADGAHDAFLSGPLDLRAGVTLRVDAKTILFGSRDPRVYEVSPGSCGIVSQTKGGWRALINGRKDRESTRLKSS